MKTVLMLINGFGIEKDDSFEVYNQEIMPTFDTLMKKYIFARLTSGVNTIYEGYRNMSLEIGELYNYHIYTRESDNGNIKQNNTVNQILTGLDTRKSKLHLFAFVDTSLKISDNIKSFLKTVNELKDKKIYIHIVLTSTNYEDYPRILDTLSKINVDISEYATIGMVIGLETILNSNPIVELNFFLKTLITEVGERWQSFKQKLDVSYGTKKSPTSMKPFVVNNGFALGSNDLFMIWNYDNIDLTNFINGVKAINYGKETTNNISFYSLFPITYSEQIPYVLNYEKSEKSLSANMKGLNFKSLVMSDTKDINVINYYLNGLDNVNNQDITYIDISQVGYNVEKIVNIINTYPQELTIINYDITKSDTIEKLQEELSQIDKVIEGIYNIFINNDLNIIISSIYGMEKTLPNEKEEMCHVKYDKVPIIYVSKQITRKDYIINDGNINDLLKICYKSINQNYHGETMLIKKNFLYKLIFK